MHKKIGLSIIAFGIACFVGVFHEIMRMEICTVSITPFIFLIFGFGIINGNRKSAKWAMAFMALYAPDIFIFIIAILLNQYKSTLPHGKIWGNPYLEKSMIFVMGLWCLLNIIYLWKYLKKTKPAESKEKPLYFWILAPFIILGFFIGLYSLLGSKDHEKVNIGLFWNREVNTIEIKANTSNLKNYGCLAGSENNIHGKEYQAFTIFEKDSDPEVIYFEIFSHGIEQEDIELIDIFVDTKIRCELTLENFAGSVLRDYETKATCESPYLLEPGNYHLEAVRQKKKEFQNDTTDSLAL